MGETDRQEGHATAEGIALMKRTGRKRRERRAQRAEAAKAATSPESTQAAESRGLGAPVAEHGNETLIKNQRMEARALLEEWPIKEQYREPLINGQVMIALDPKQEPRHRTRAFMALLAANKQNMDAKGQTGGGTQVNVNVGVQVVESDDWYGTRAAAESRAFTAQSNGASAGDSVIPGPVQGGSNGKALGQNGYGSNGHH